MAKRGKRSGREGESLAVFLALLAYYAYDKLIVYPLVASIIFGLVVSLIVLATLLILRASRVRKANLLAKESLYRDYSPIEFEHLTAEIFRQLGYKAHVTPASGDKGLDVILESEGEKIGVQCKRHQDAIGPGLIREFSGALEGARLNQGFFVTTSNYTEASKEAAKSSRFKIKLIDGEKLGELRNKAEKRINTDLIAKPWWGVMSNWQKGLIIALFFICVTLVVSVASYILITTSSL